MAPNHLEDFLKALLHHRNFRRFSGFSASKAQYYLPHQILQAHLRDLRARESHVEMCMRVMKDMKEANVPILSLERNQLMHMAYYRDRPDIMKVIQQAQKSVGEPESETAQFDWKTFQNLLSPSVDADTLNTLLFIAFRHEKHLVVDELRPHVEKVGNRRTYGILIEHFGYFGQVDKLVSVLQAVAIKFEDKMDIYLLNLIIKGLVLNGEPALAHSLLSESTPAAAPFLQLQTREHREEYWQRVQEYDKGEYPTCRIHYIHDTFVPLVPYIAKQGFNHLVSTMDDMDRLGIPMPTRFFLEVFASDWTLEELHFFTSKLLSIHDATHQNEGLKQRIAALNLPDEVSRVLQQNNTSPSSLLKLLDELMHAVYKAYLHSTVNHTEVAQREQQLYDTLKEIPKEKASLSQRLHVRNERTYIKRLHLVQLLSL